ncbi:hypothetical protein, partial [Streptomyces sp. NPDC005859]|uniref:hypothetical protein n=1 Tax=Streptomyces sp. NPDC005859 TaxID=3157170 RepID=UPI0033CD9098
VTSLSSARKQLHDARTTLSRLGRTDGAAGWRGRRKGAATDGAAGWRGRRSGACGRIRPLV